MITQFKAYLAKTNLAENTITSYVWTVTYYLEHYKEVNKKNLLAYKGYLVENFKPQTVNLRLQAVNKFLEFSKQEKLRMKFFKSTYRPTFRQIAIMRVITSDFCLGVDAFEQFTGWLVRWILGDKFAMNGEVKDF